MSMCIGREAQMKVAGWRDLFAGLMPTDGQ